MPDLMYASDPVRSYWPAILRRIKQNLENGWAAENIITPAELNSLLSSGLVYTCIRNNVRSMDLTSAGKSIITG